METSSVESTGGGNDWSPSAVSGAVGPNVGLSGVALPPFLVKTYDMVDDPTTDAVVSWGPGNNSFVVWNTPEFARDILPKHFKHNNFSSFVRQLNTYGFRKVDPDRWEFAHEGFLRGQKHLLKTIVRRKASNSHIQNQQPQQQNASVTACVEVGKFGLEEEIEILKRDKNVLMQELVRLRQQQQSTDHQLQTMGKRLQGMEQRQQQMMSFLAKAMHSPGFLAQFVQQNDSNMRITSVNKKRRLPKQEGDLEAEPASPDGQIIKYQPLINEAAKAMLRKILSFDSSNRLESFGNSDHFMIENYAPAEGLDRSSSTRNSGVTLAEVPTVPSSSGLPYMNANTVLSAICSSAAASNMQPPPPIGLAESNLPKELSTMGILPTDPATLTPNPKNMDIPDFVNLQDVVPENAAANIPADSFLMPEADGSLLSTVADTDVPIEMDEILYDTETKLPSIIESFWEQFLVTSPSLDPEEVGSSEQEGKGLQNGWNNAGHMADLTEQMGLLSSTPRK